MQRFTPRKSTRWSAVNLDARLRENAAAATF
jgi:hypothetical protein